MNEKIRMHSAYTSEAYAAEEAMRSECSKSQAECVASIELLRKQLDEVRPSKKTL